MGSITTGGRSATALPCSEARHSAGVRHLVAARPSASYCPVAHATQPELPYAPAVEYVPTLHATHSVEALLS